MRGFSSAVAAAFFAAGAAYAQTELAPLPPQPLGPGALRAQGPAAAAVEPKGRESDPQERLLEE